MDSRIPVIRLVTNEMSGMTLDYHNNSLSLSVIDALATELDADPIELEPLYNVIDPEALDQLFKEDAAATVTVQFTYDGHAVEVRSDGTIQIDGTVHERS